MQDQLCGGGDGPEAIEGHDHAERALRAFAIVVAEQGYVNTTVEAVLRRAQMSATTFYADFHGKDDAMLAAIDSACSQILAALLPAFRRAPDWPTGVRAGYGALCNFLASRPALAHLIAVEIYAAGPVAVERRSETLQPLEELIGPGKAGDPDHRQAHRGGRGNRTSPRQRNHFSRTSTAPASRIRKPDSSRPTTALGAPESTGAAVCGRPSVTATRSKT